jgi:hypothetical protein
MIIKFIIYGLHISYDFTDFKQIFMTIIRGRAKALPSHSHSRWPRELRKAQFKSFIALRVLIEYGISILFSFSLNLESFLRYFSINLYSSEIGTRFNHK